MKRIHFLTLIRWPNVALTIIAQTIFFFGYVVPYCTPASGQRLSFFVLTFATGAILAAGNIFNDIMDIPVDYFHPRKNKLVGSEIPVSIAWKLYFLLNIVALGGVLVTGFMEWNLILALVFPIAVGLLILYSRFLKNTVLRGNIMIAFLCAAAIYITSLITPQCPLDRTFQPENQESLIFYGYIINAFLVTLLRETVKDKEDYPFDRKAGIRTIGIWPDRYFSALFYGLILFIALLNAFGMYLLYLHLTSIQWVIGFLILYIPLFIMIVIYGKGRSPQTYARLSRMIKIYIILALFLLILWI